jgi:hypothetical protein
MQTRLPTGMFRPSVYVPPRRRRGWIMTTIAVVLTFVTATVLWASTTDPLAAGSFGVAPRWSDGTAFQRDFAADPADGTAFTHYSGRQDGRRTFFYAVSIRNEGRLPIQVRTIGTSGAAGVAVRAIAVETDPMSGATIGYPTAGADASTLAGIGGFTVDADEEAVVVLVAQLNDCVGPDGMTTLVTVPITYAVLGVPRSVDFAPGVQIALRDGTCRAG